MILGQTKESPNLYNTPALFYVYIQRKGVLAGNRERKFRLKNIATLP